MTLAHASAPPSASARTSTSTEDDGGRGEDNEFKVPQEALAELVDAAQNWRSSGRPSLVADAKRIQHFFVLVEVAILRQRRRNEASRAAIDRVVRVERDDETRALGPVQTGDRQLPAPILDFTTLVCRELFRPYGDFVEAHRTPKLEAIQAEALSVLAREQEE